MPVDELTCTQCLYIYLSSFVTEEAKTIRGTIDEYFNIICGLSTSSPGPPCLRENRTATGKELFSRLTYLHNNNIYIAKYLFSIRDDYYKILGDTTVLAREMFSSDRRSRVKNARA